MRREIPEDIDVALHQTEANANGVEVEQVSNLAGIDQGLHAANCTRVQECVVHHQCLSRTVRELN